MSICVNHPNREATSRCSSCHKPICGDCIVKAGDAVYCSQTCQQNAERFAKNFKPASGPGFFERLKNTILGALGLAMLFGVVALICAKVFKIAFFVSLLNKLGI